jgi:3D (Asp-Asp-Asp) domain-containing protein
MKRSLLLAGLLVANAASAATNFTATVTAYCACQKCCGPNASGLAANGKPPIEGVTVAGPRRFKLGTKVTIATVGARVINDRLARKYDDRFDVYFTDHQAARRFGIRRLTVTVE